LGKLAHNSQIPYKDFFIRDPVYIYLVALSIRTLGISFPVVSLVSIVPSVLTAPILYKISREIFDRLTGLVFCFDLQLRTDGPLV